MAESKPTINPGDVVSQPDGPPMTVDYIEGDFVHCVWFVGETLMRDSFRRQRLGVMHAE